ncbi:MAG: nuclear transport factor 2 family protein [Acidobacteriota bacterium]|nr:nuclear transport factor 2 family protein [Acidobacteriota bacterium]
MKNVGIIFAAGILSASALISGYTALAQRAPGNEEIVRKFEAAFNKHDVAAMAALVADEAQWFNIEGDKMAVETNGKAAMEKWLKGYFQSCPSCRSEFEALMLAGSFVTVHEKAMWESKSGPKSQKGLGVYEVRDGLIRRVWYYPAEK